MTCERNALVLSALGAIAIGAILTFDGVTVDNRRLHFRSPAWRLLRWAAWLSFLLGIALAAFFRGSV
jgi:hypothetical protein